MESDLLTMRFFKTNDKKISELVYPLPKHWWSRFYEYAWAAEFCNDTDVVLDAACGIPHPFKFFLAQKCKAAHAIDLDEQVLDHEKMGAAIDAMFGPDARKNCVGDPMKSVLVKQGDITALPYRNNMFDKVFCISVLEHLSDENKQKALREFRRVLKNNGMVILTLDYPDTDMITMKDFAEMAGLRLAGGIVPALPDDAITWGRRLYCFRMVLVKDVK